MKVIVTSVFRDKFTHRLYNCGDSFDIKDEARVQDLELFLIRLPNLTKKQIPN